MKNPAENVNEYTNNLPDERREPVRRLVQLLRDNMPPGYEEAMTWGMPTWQVPLSRYPDTYNKQPLMYVALASQKNHIALYLSAPYMMPDILLRLQEGFRSAGKKLDMGKSCIRFKKIEDIPVETIANCISSVSAEELISIYEHTRRR